MCFAKTFESAAGVTAHTIGKLFSWMKLVYVCVIKYTSEYATIE